MCQFPGMHGMVCALAVGALLAGDSAATAQTGGGGGTGRSIVVLGATSGLGVSVTDLTAAQAKEAHLPAPAGAYVQQVAEDGAAEKAGVKPGDVIVEFDGEAVRSAAQLSRLIAETPAGRTVKVVVMRGGKRTDLSATLDRADRGLLERQFDMQVRPPILQFPQPQPRLPREPRNPNFAPPLFRYDGAPQLGVNVQELSPQLRDYFGVRQGVLVATVTASSPAARAGMKAGDVITSIDSDPVRTPDELRRVLADHRSGDQVTVNVIRDRKALALKVTLDASRTRIVPI